MICSIKPVSLAKEKTVLYGLGPKLHVKKKIFMDLEQNRRLKVVPGNRYKRDKKGPDLEITSPQSVQKTKI